jgi:MFS family permease
MHAAFCCFFSPQLLLLSRACVDFGLAGAPVAFTLLMEMLPASSGAMWRVLIELAWTVGT